ncbi:hypothetical protein BOX15_Mlig014954g1 [Macrostomum lignano]|uniref:BZIP domain-containing protein n=2 Tax=Macrostomum lignano TaxID=282301 RepID=A0A267GJR3_9PLAT|nr:hypothetical protein BOX15_Mlig014954g1 [Macrostomum lignano]
MDPTDMTLPPDSDALSPSPDSILSPNSSGGGGCGGNGPAVRAMSIAAPCVRQPSRPIDSRPSPASSQHQSGPPQQQPQPPASNAILSSSTSTATATVRDLAYQRRRERNNEAARASRLNRKARHEATRRALARLQTLAPLARLRRIQTEMEVRGLCAAAGQDYDCLLATAVAQIGVPTDYFAAVVNSAGGGGGGGGGNVEQPNQVSTAERDEKYLS